MKNKYLLILFAAVLTLNSCKKDSVEKNSDRLNGTWNLESVADVQYENGVEVDRDANSDLNLNWEFRNDGTATVNVDGGDVEVTWSTTETVLSLVAASEGKSRVDFNIKSLSKNDMHLEYINYDEAENGVSYRSVREYKLRKK
ncbi:hypothetical protein PBAL39_20495 [Pedobacter sp. BAL39]|uniref:lipocalin family protein n=1 Tax=Pedobacter sp. BAL39 TaxID=391596 RepID=UPI000155A18C|nr:lipocalin family protein [Pedobacter sp. BAL39]EDM38490.1 hypothetical protein PBAL39_20495 [Pedobacter sp. BAL39]